MDLFGFGFLFALAGAMRHPDRHPVLEPHLQDGFYLSFLVITQVQRIGNLLQPLFNLVLPAGLSSGRNRVASYRHNERKRRRARRSLTNLA